ncbi:glucosaminidase domain-containing protein [Sulfurimonas sp. SAG-AH-194-I05]|nr:glucosaminidase domain-containing protein [Sulfurimonas sp. SAG-AH-194-I05]MDF1875161.1 glucosaminidase domain-containing protein [Sulfurimonas sp. SAG-AH-194-I05]
MSFNTQYYRVDTIPLNMSVATKKERFYHLVVPSIVRVHKKLLSEYLRTKSNVDNNRIQTRIKYLREQHKVTTNKDLLLAMKPHPPSIVIAQAAMESAWGTSRFFREANNVFGMWSKNPKEARIAAGIKRNGNTTIWLRKFYSIDESVKEYYALMGKGKAFHAFRKVRYETDDVFKIIKKLDKYSEIGHLYGEELGKLIRFNKLTQYDK